VSTEEVQTTKKERLRTLSLYWRAELSRGKSPRRGAVVGGEQRLDRKAERNQVVSHTLIFTSV
jgi:hypothetical protein